MGDLDHRAGAPEDALGARPYQSGLIRTPARERPVRDDPGVRPYVLTGGRTRSSNALIGFETMVTMTPGGHTGRPNETNERRAILDRCDRPISVVELSAHLRLPLGVAQVLTGDLADEGFLRVHAAPTAPSRDRALLERLARAVQNKQTELA
jgi:hypothetical protein